MEKSEAEAGGADFLFGDGEMTRLIRSKDWDNTPLGPMTGWPQSLRTTVSLCLASNFPINIIWGSSNTQIYNDGYRIVCGDAHPDALGQGYDVTWKSAWPAIGGPFEQARSGHTSFLQNQRMFLTRNGYLEETFFTFSLSPIRDESGDIGGLFHPVTETTASMLSERRTRVLRDLTSSLSGAASFEDLSRLTIETLSAFEFDLPFVLLYLLSSDGKRYELAGRHGIQQDTAASPPVLQIAAKTPWPANGATASAGIVEVGDLAGVFAGLKVGPYEEPPSRALVMPLAASGDAPPPAILVAGASPRLPLDDTYRGFFELLAAAMSAAIATVRAREDERRRAEVLAEIDRAKTAFFSNVSHEFRTPLTLMLGPIEDALEEADGLPALQQQRLRVAHRNALRLLKLVNTLLDFSRIEAGRTQAHFEPVDLASLTADLASTFRSACERAGLKLTVDCRPFSRPMPVDPDMWEKIVLNLISNAFKFTLEGEIKVTLEETATGAELTVSDSGIGIPAEQLPRIFERFHRVEGQRGRSHEGTGIGLSLVKELVSLHAGTISASSEDGKGSTFRIVLPSAVATATTQDRPPVKERSSHSQRTAAFVEEALRWLPGQQGALAPEAALHGYAAAIEGQPRVILADDNADMRSYVRRILEDGGYHVEVVENGAQALAAARRRPMPDLVLSDVMMPELDGFQLLKQLRDDPALDGLLVILLSARAGEEARIEGLEAGADDYLVKPFSARELRARIDGAIRLSSMRRQAAQRDRELHTVLATKRSHAALKETEQQLEVALNAARMGTWSVDFQTRELSTSDICRKDYGWPQSQPMTYQDLMGLIHPADRERREKQIAEALSARQDLEVEYRIIRPEDGEIAWILVRGRAEFDASGTPLRSVGVSLDITHRKRAEERQRLLVAELNHRVKNTLASVQSIALQTQRASKSPAEFTLALDARIRALATAHDMLTANSWEGAQLKDVVTRTLAPYNTAQTPSRLIEVSGPTVRLDPEAAVTLNMAFHELATNAVKHGALSRAEGGVCVEWSVDKSSSAAALDIIWREHGGPPVAEPSRRGFGAYLLETGLAHELDGDVKLEFRPDGLVCRMRYKVSRRIDFQS